MSAPNESTQLYEKKLIALVAEQASAGETVPITIAGNKTEGLALGQTPRAAGPDAQPCHRCTVARCKRLEGDLAKANARLADADLMAVVVRTGYTARADGWTDEQYRKTTLRAQELHAQLDAERTARAEAKPGIFAATYESAEPVAHVHDFHPLISNSNLLLCECGATQIDAPLNITSASIAQPMPIGYVDGWIDEPRLAEVRISSGANILLHDPLYAAPGVPGKPFAWMTEDGGSMSRNKNDFPADVKIMPLYAAPGAPSEDAQDAARYRYWRKHYRGEFVICLPSNTLKFDAYNTKDFRDINCEPLVDAAIDAARGKP